ncbi:MAG: flavodoxin family protein [Candidatus Bipolaricaulia bacterium]
MSKVAIIYHSYQGVTEDLIDSLAEGVKGGGGEANLFQAGQADIEDLLDSDKFVLACGQPFGTLAGPMKTFLENLWMAKDKEKLEGKPYTFLLNGNEVPEETAERLKTIGDYFGWNLDQSGVKVGSDQVEETLSQCRKLGEGLIG